MSYHRVPHQLQAVHGDALAELRVEAEQVLLVVGVNMGVGVKLVGVLDGGKRDGDGLPGEDGPEGLHVLHEGGRAGKGVVVGAGSERHVNGVEDEGHVQPGVGRMAGLRQRGVDVDDVGRHEGGEATALSKGSGVGGLVRRPSVADELSRRRSGVVAERRGGHSRARRRRRWAACWMCRTRRRS
jgi:hypothetical protein